MRISPPSCTHPFLIDVSYWSACSEEELREREILPEVKCRYKAKTGEEVGLEGSNGKPSKSKILYSSHTSPDKKSTLSAAAAAAAEEEETEERKRGRKI